MGKLLKFQFIIITLILCYLTSWREVPFFILPSLIFFLSNRKYLLPPIILLNSALISLLLLEAAHFYLYQTKATSGIYLAIFETNYSEMIEFLEGQTVTPFLIAITLGVILAAFGAKISFRIPRKMIQLSLIVSMFISVLSFKHLSNDSSLRLIKHYITYKNEISSFHERLTFKKNSPINITQFSQIEERTVVFVLGESLTRNRMSVYGYERPTTPRLQEDKSLIFFQDIISPHTQTHKSLKKVLTLLNHDNQQKLHENFNIVQLARASGYRTYWISNQYALGKYENPQTLIAKDSHEIHWLNKEGSLDELVIPAFSRVLQKDEKKKFIVIHLMGTHAHYKNRFSKDFSVFHEAPVTKLELNSQQIEIYNDYDNAVLYQDFILSTLITQLREKAKNFHFLFFPDHGEEVFQDDYLYGHPESRATLNMFEIPMIFDTSDEDFRSLAMKRIHHSWSTEDFIHLLHSLLGIHTLEYEEGRDLFSEGYLEKERFAGQGPYKKRGP